MEIILEKVWIIFKNKNRYYIDVLIDNIDLIIIWCLINSILNF